MNSSCHNSLASWWSQADSVKTGGRSFASLRSLDEDHVGAILSQFLLESASRQLRLFNLSSLAEETVSLNLGEGVDYSVDQTKTDGGQAVVVKHPKAVVLKGSRQALEVQRIRKALQELRIATHSAIRHHENVISLMGYSWAQEEGATTTPCLVFEFAEGGNLCQFLQGQALSVEDRIDLVIGVARGIQVLHSYSILHGDIKMDNILVCRNERGIYVAKVADFGSSVLGKGKETIRVFGTAEYNAPEVRQSGDDSVDGTLVKVELSAALDVYSFGLLLIEVALQGLRYVDAEIEALVRAKKYQTIGQVALAKIDKTDVGQHLAGQRYLSAARLALSSNADERPQITSVIWRLNGEDHHQGQAEIIPAEDELYDEPGEFLIDLSDPVSFFAVLRGRGAEGSRLQMPPWSVMKEVASQYRLLSTSDDRRLAGFCHMCMSVCHYTGFGTERSKEKACDHLNEAAKLGSLEACATVDQLFRLCDQNPSQIQFPENLDSLDKKKFDILKKGFENSKRVPFYELQKIPIEFERSSAIESTLHTAAAIGDVKDVKSRLLGGEKDRPNKDGQTAVLLACFGGHLEVVETLLKYGSDASIPDRNGFTPLHMLVMFNEPDIPSAAELLKRSSSDPDINAVSTVPFQLPGYWDELVGTPLCWSVIACNETAVDALLTFGASLEPCAPSLSPLYLAASLNLYWILEKLIQTKYCTKNIISAQNPLFSLNESHPYRLIQIHGQELSSAAFKTVKVLQRHWDVNTRNRGGWTPLIKIAMTNLSFNDLFIAKALMVDTNKSAEDPNFSTIIAGIMGCNACQLRSHAELAISLIEAGFDPLATSSAEGDWPGYNAMHWAAATQNSAVIDALVKQDATILESVTQAEQAETPLHVAAAARYGFENVKQLLTLGANPVHESGYQLTPLAMVISGTREDLDVLKLELLLKANAANSYVVQDAKGLQNSILHLAVLHEAKLSLHGVANAGLLRHLLQDSGVRRIIDQPNSAGLTPFHIACFSVGYGAIRVLVEGGADAFLRTPQGLSGLGVVLEIANRPERGIGDKDLTEEWYKAAFEAAVYLADFAKGSSHDKGFSRLHLATYVGYADEVERIIWQDPDTVNLKDAKGLTARELLFQILYRIEHEKIPCSADWLLRISRILNVLDNAMPSS